MVTFFTTTLVISLVGLVGLISVKRFEITTGRVVFGRLRPKQRGLLHRVFVFIERVLAAIIRYFIVMSYRWVRSHIQRSIAWIILHVERALEKWLHIVREKTTVRPGRGEASSFLRAVADHKTKLLSGSKAERAIFED